jgi:hypothetical protein
LHPYQGILQLTREYKWVQENGKFTKIEVQFIIPQEKRVLQPKAFDIIAHQKIEQQRI